jgi:hypothetical protein
VDNQHIKLIADIAKDYKPRGAVWCYRILLSPCQSLNLTKVRNQNTDDVRFIGFEPCRYVLNIV